MSWPVRAYRGGGVYTPTPTRAPPGYVPGKPANENLPGGRGPRGPFRFTPIFRRIPWLTIYDLAKDADDIWRHRQGGPQMPAGWTKVRSCVPRTIDRYFVTNAGCLTGQGGSSPMPANLLSFHNQVSFHNYYEQFPGVWASRTVEEWSRTGYVGPLTVRSLPAVWAVPHYKRPYVNPAVYPPGFPLAYPNKPVPGRTPFLDPLNNSTRGEPDKQRQADLAGVPRTATRTMTVTGTSPWANKPTTRNPPPEGTKERKLKFNAGMRLLIRVANGVTELNDFVDALHAALPDSPCKNQFDPKDGKSASPMQKGAAVYKCFGQIDWDKAVFNVIWQQIEDAAWAKLGMGTKEFNRLQGSNMGVNRLMSEVWGDHWADTLGSAESWFREKANKYLGLTV